MLQLVDCLKWRVENNIDGMLAVSIAVLILYVIIWSSPIYILPLTASASFSYSIFCTVIFEFLGLLSAVSYIFGILILDFKFVAIVTLPTISNWNAAMKVIFWGWSQIWKLHDLMLDEFFHWCSTFCCKVRIYYFVFIQKPILPVELYRDIRDSQLIGLSGYSNEVSI